MANLPPAFRPTTPATRSGVPLTTTETTLLAEAILDGQLLHRQRRRRETIEFEARLAALDQAVELGDP
jgi:hypothetical protein